MHPGSARAAAASMLSIHACPCGERSTRPCSRCHRHSAPARSETARFRGGAASARYDLRTCHAAGCHALTYIRRCPRCGGGAKFKVSRRCEKACRLSGRSAAGCRDRRRSVRSPRSNRGSARKRTGSHNARRVTVDNVVRRRPIASTRPRRRARRRCELFSEAEMVREDHAWHPIEAKSAGQRKSRCPAAPIKPKWSR
jgi:hypothetical protein